MPNGPAFVPYASIATRGNGSTLGRMARSASRVDRTIDVLALTAGLSFLAFSVVGVIVYVEALIRLDFLVRYTVGLAMVAAVVWLWHRREHRLDQRPVGAEDPATRRVSVDFLAVGGVRSPLHKPRRWASHHPGSLLAVPLRAALMTVETWRRSK